MRFRRKFHPPATDDRNPCPADGTNIFVRVAFLWISDLVRLGHLRSLTVNDIALLPENMQANEYFANFQQTWLTMKERMLGQKHILLWTLLSAHFWRYHMAMFSLKWLVVLSTFFKPLLLNYMLQSLKQMHGVFSSPDPYLLALALAVAATFQALTVHFYFWQGVQNALAVRGSLIGLIEDKVLRMHSSVKNKYPAGVIINLCSVDADNIMSFCWNSIHEVWASPIMILVSLIWLIELLGSSALAGCAIMLLSVAISAGVSASNV